MGSIHGSKKKEKRELITQTEFARRMDISETVARRAIKRGRIPIEGEGRNKKVIWPDARAAFNEKRDLSKVRKKDVAKVAEQLVESGVAGIDENGATESPDLWRARAVKEKYLAEIRKLEYLERTGELVSAKAVEDAAFEKGRQIRDALINIPDRTSEVIAKEVIAVAAQSGLFDKYPKLIDQLAKKIKASRVHEIQRSEIEIVLKKFIEQ